MLYSTRFRVLFGTLLVTAAALAFAAVQRGPAANAQPQEAEAYSPVASHAREPFERHVLQALNRGRQTFRHDTFGDEEFWGDTLHLDGAIAGAANGGVGPGLSPRAALGLGLKVDVEALPRAVRSQLRAGAVDLDDPAVTLLLLRERSVLGVTGFFDGDALTSVGIQCALCHSTVDDSLAAGIGRRLDGWANRDLDIGAIVALAPDLSAFADLLGVSQDTVRQVFRSWGPGKFDAALALDGKAFQDPPANTRSAATLIPPAFGLAGVNLHTWTGWGSVTHWNAFVANLEMHGKGTFYDPRLDDAAQFPIAAANGFGNVRNTPDLITRKLADLHLYQLALAAPPPPPGSFDRAAAKRGAGLVFGDAGLEEVLLLREVHGLAHPAEGILALVLAGETDALEAAVGDVLDIVAEQAGVEAENAGGQAVLGVGDLQLDGLGAR
jgi:hypothetical protein